MSITKEYLAAQTKQLSEKITCQIEVLTPTHVGSGQVWYKDIDYMVDDKIIHLINKDELYRLLYNEAGANKNSAFDEYCDILSRRQMDNAMEKFILDKFDIKEIAYNSKDEKAKFFDAYCHRLPAGEIREFIRTGQGQIYLPGSSIKGAIRSALYWLLFQGSGKRGQDVERGTEASLLGTFHQAFTRYLLPSDVEMSATEVSNIYLFNLIKTGTGWASTYKNGTNRPFISAETLKIGAQGQFSFAVAQGFAKKVLDLNKNIVMPSTNTYLIKKENPIQSIFNTINEYTYSHINKEIDFFKKYPQADGSEQIIHELEKLRYLAANNDNSCILRLSYGAGFHGITGDYRFTSHLETIEKPDGKNLVYSQRDRTRMPARYKSRRIVENAMGYFPMGFIKISLPESAERIVFSQKIVAAPRQLENHKNHNQDEADNTIINKPAAKSGQAQNIDAKNVVAGTILSAEVLAIGKPHGTARLFLDNYPYPLETKLMGLKKVTLAVGAIIRVKVNSISKDGKINDVTVE